MLEKVAEILTVARKPVLKDHLMSRCGLSSLMFKVYVVHLLLPRGLLDAYPVTEQGGPGRQTRRRMVYQISQKGRKFLELYKELQKSMS